jgi:hypothetical protein
MKKTTRTDVENYEKFDSVDGGMVFANSLVERLRHKFPHKDIRVKHKSPFRGYDAEYGKAVFSNIYEVTGKILGIIPIRKELVELWAGRLPGYSPGIEISNSDLREIVEKETNKLNEISGAKIRVSYGA